MLGEFPITLLKPVQSKADTVVGASKCRGEAYEIGKCAFSCPNKKCLDYGKKDSGNIVVHSRYGKHDEIRMLKCKTCGSYFSERTNTALYNCKLPEDKALEVIYYLSKGCSIRKINRLTGVSRDAISRLAHIERQHANSLCDELVRYLKHKKVLSDEK